MARYLDRLNQLAAAAGTVAELTRSTQIYRYAVGGASHLYLHTGASELMINRHNAPEIVISTLLQPPFAWRIASEQDDVGVYFVALRKALVGAVAIGKFEVSVPYTTHIILRLEEVRLTMASVSDTLDLPGQVK